MKLQSRRFPWCTPVIPSQSFGISLRDPKGPAQGPGSRYGQCPTVPSYTSLRCFKAVQGRQLDPTGFVGGVVCPAAIRVLRSGANVQCSRVSTPVAAASGLWGGCCVGGPGVLLRCNALWRSASLSVRGAMVDEDPRHREPERWRRQGVGRNPSTVRWVLCRRRERNRRFLNSWLGRHSPGSVSVYGADAPDGQQMRSMGVPVEVS